MEPRRHLHVKITDLRERKEKIVTFQYQGDELETHKREYKYEDENLTPIFKHALADGHVINVTVKNGIIVEASIFE